MKQETPQETKTAHARLPVKAPVTAKPVPGSERIEDLNAGTLAFESSGYWPNDKGRMLERLNAKQYENAGSMEFDDGLKVNIEDGMAFRGTYNFRDERDIGFGQRDVDYSSHEIVLGVSWDLDFTD